MEVSRWELGHASFEGLLRKLSPDREQAAAEYERLRFRLTKFFQWRSAENPEEFADLTLDRLARRLEAGEHIEPLYSYCCGIARMLLLEARRTNERRADALRVLETSSPQASVPHSNETLPLDALSKCLAGLPVESRNLVLDYYQGEKQPLIERRKALAERLGIPINALRLRVNRIRVQLEKCVRESLPNMDRQDRPFKGK